MKKAKVSYNCTECGGISSRWVGQCNDCGKWNTMTEVIAVNNKSPRLGGYAGNIQSGIINLKDVAVEDVLRISSDISELDLVLGGGVVPGSAVLIGGDPGIGKSTILLQLLANLSKKNNCLYVTGEESLTQVKLRASRLGLKDIEIKMLPETKVETIIKHAEIEKPKFIVIDSIQTMFTELLQSAPGAVGQVRESASQLVRFAKQTNTCIFLVGHVTKEGALAGPRVLEHMVDTVLYFEGDSGSKYRVVRAVKNRFGAVNELGVFAMTHKGLLGVNNPSAIFLSRYEEPASGSIVTTTWEGTRPLLVEVQALVDESHLANPRRVCVGLEQSRLALILAVLNRHIQVTTYDMDVFVNVVGGVKITETGTDLPILLAVLSSLKNKPIDLSILSFGEIGLAGEIRPVPNGQERLKEAKKHGFKKAIIPIANAPKEKIEGMEIIGVKWLSDLKDIMIS